MTEHHNVFAETAFEKQVEAQCDIILKKTAEYWEDRNKAILELTVFVCLTISFKKLNFNN